MYVVSPFTHPTLLSYYSLLLLLFFLLLPPPFISACECFFGWHSGELCSVDEYTSFMCRPYVLPSECVNALLEFVSRMLITFPRVHCTRGYCHVAYNQAGVSAVPRRVR